MNSIPERLTRLETHLEHLVETVDKISSTQDAIKAKVTKAETQVTFAGTALRYVYPPGSALVVWIVANLGLVPLPR